MAVKIASMALVALGLITLFYDFVMLNVMNFNAGMVFVAIFGIVLAVIGVFLKDILRMKWLLITIAACFALLFSLVIFIYSYGRNNNVNYKEEAVIVLGCGLRGDQVRGQLADRLDTAVSYSQKNPNAIIVVSGGQGPGETITEALAMERYLVAKGVPKERILKEESSVSTQTNMKNSKELLDSVFEGEYTVAIVTGDYHIYRAVKYAKDVGFNCKHIFAPVELYNFPLCALRESAAVLKAWILD